MINAVAALTGLLSLAGTVVAQETKPVYAHFMVGIVPTFTKEDWKSEMQEAQSIGIDGFALNCAPPDVDDYTPDQLAYAYAAAEELDFKVFISFDFAYWTPGHTDLITDYLANFTSSPAQASWNDGAIVSTFIGGAMNWNPVKDALGDQKLTVLPNVEDPGAIPGDTNGWDGAFSWYAWPTSGNNVPIKGPMTTEWDDKFLENLGDKPYMAPVSPWFFTHFGNKNWAFICEEQPTLRWEQMLEMKPPMIEIISWNDFGESHYISGAQPNHKDDGSSAWTDGFPHDAWQTLMKPYIAAYKAGEDAPTVESDQLVYWYRPTPKDAQCSGDSLPAPDGRDLMEDVVFVSTLLTEAAELTVTSGRQEPVTVQVEAGIHTASFPMGVGQQKFSVSRGGNEILGDVSEKEVSDSCEIFNFNAYVGSL